MPREFPLRAFDVRVSLTNGAPALVKDDDVFEIDDVGALIWQACDGQHTLQEIGKLLSRSFDVDEQTAVTDSAGYVEDLRAAGLVDDD